MRNIRVVNYMMSAMVMVGSGLLILTLPGCSESATTNEAGDGNISVAADEQYDENSWKELIPDSCKSYFDGCNNCTRNPESGIAACTRKACFKYEKPRCLDDEAQTPQNSSEAVTPAESAMIKASFECEGGNSFTVFFHEYVADDQRMKLTQDEMMFSDSQTHTTTLMTREPSASGGKYSGDGITYWGKGNEAFVMHGDKRIYNNCVKQP